MIWAPPHEAEVVGEDSSLLAAATPDQSGCCGVYRELGVVFVDRGRGMALLHESASYQGYL